MMRPESFRLLVGAGVLSACVFGYTLSLRPANEPAFVHDIVTNIEEYRKDNRLLPDPANAHTLQELEILGNKEGVMSYQLIDFQNYLLIKYNKNGIGPSWYYDSRSKKWFYGTPSNPGLGALTAHSQFD
ncbi:hypothetical protein Rhal01_01773 [Rubritalea halochordaticola]|uniref:Type II secretion system protein GspG C-terminal domain-containing protein n=1 Tax=Rubritalea halochordaticola TaxID=714537 RepID=A0ABP9V106_9BACT